MFGPCPLGAVVCVAEVPWCAWLYGLLALGACDFAGCYLGFPLFAEGYVFAAVASLLAAASCAFGFCFVGGAEAVGCCGWASWLGADAFSSGHYFSQRMAAVLIIRWMVLSAMIMSQTDSHAGVSDG